MHLAFDIRHKSLLLVFQLHEEEEEGGWALCKHQSLALTGACAGGNRKNIRNALLMTTEREIWEKQRKNFKFNKLRRRRRKIYGDDVYCLFRFARSLLLLLLRLREA